MTPMADKLLMASVKFHKGYREKAYLDSVGVWTIGYGTNLQSLTIDKSLAELWLSRSLEDAETGAETLPGYAHLNSARQAVLIEMVYNMGLPTVRKFVNTLAAVAEGRYDDAANGMRASRWATQVGKRARRLAMQMETGEFWNAENV